MKEQKMLKPSKIFINTIKLITTLFHSTLSGFGPSTDKPQSPTDNTITLYKKIPDFYLSKKDYYNLSLSYFLWGDNTYSISSDTKSPHLEINGRLSLAGTFINKEIEDHCIDEVIFSDNNRHYICDKKFIFSADLYLGDKEVVYKFNWKFDIFKDTDYAQFEMLECQQIWSCFRSSHVIFGCYGRKGNDEYIILGGYPKDKRNNVKLYKFKQDPNGKVGVLRNFTLFETKTRNSNFKIVYILDPYRSEPGNSALSYILTRDEQDGNKIKFYDEKVVDFLDIGLPKKMVIRSIDEILAYSDIPYYHTLISGYIKGEKQSQFISFYLDPPESESNFRNFKVNRSITLAEGNEEEIGFIDGSQIKLDGAQFYMATDKYFMTVFMISSYEKANLRKVAMNCQPDKTYFKDIIPNGDFATIVYRKKGDIKTNSIGIFAFKSIGYCFTGTSVDLTTFINYDEYKNTNFGEARVYVSLTRDKTVFSAYLKEYNSLEVNPSKFSEFKEMNVTLKAKNRANESIVKDIGFNTTIFDPNDKEKSYFIDFGNSNSLDVEFGSWLKLPIDNDKAFGEDVRYSLKDISTRDSSIEFLREITLDLNIPEKEEIEDLGHVTKFVAVDSDSYVLTKEYVTVNFVIKHLIFIFDCDIFSSGNVKCNKYSKIEFSSSHLIIGFFKVKKRIVMGTTKMREDGGFDSYLIHFNEDSGERYENLDYKMNDISLKKIESRSKVTSENGLIFYVGYKRTPGGMQSLASVLTYTYRKDDTIEYINRDLLIRGNDRLLGDAFYLSPSEGNQQHHTLFDLTHERGGMATGHTTTKARFYDPLSWDLKVSDFQYKNYQGRYSFCATQKGTVFIFHKDVRVYGFLRYYGYQSEIDFDLESHKIKKIWLSECVTELNFFQVLASDINNRMYLFNFNLDSVYDARKKLHSKIRVKDSTIRFDSAVELGTPYIYTTLTYSEFIKNHNMKVLIINTKGPSIHVNTAQFLKDTNEVIVKMENSTDGKVIKENKFQINIKPVITSKLTTAVKEGIDIDFKPGEEQELDDYIKVTGPVYNTILTGNYNETNVEFTQRRHKIKKWFEGADEQFNKIESQGDWFIFLKKHEKINMVYKGTEGGQEQRLIQLNSKEMNFTDIIDFEITPIPGDENNIGIIVIDNGKFEGYGLTVFRTEDTEINGKIEKTVKNLTWTMKYQISDQVGVLFQNKDIFYILQDSPQTRSNDVRVTRYELSKKTNTYSLKTGITYFKFYARSWSVNILDEDQLFFLYSDSSLNKLGLAKLNFTTSPISIKPYNINTITINNKKKVTRLIPLRKYDAQVDSYEPFFTDGKENCNIFTSKLKCWKSVKGKYAISCYVNSIGIHDYFIRYTINPEAEASKNQNPITNFEVLGNYTVFRNFEAIKIMRAGDYYGLMLQNMKTEKSKSEVKLKNTEDEEKNEKINIFKCSHLIAIFHRDYQHPWTVYNCYDLDISQNKTGRFVDFSLHYHKFTRLLVIRPPCSNSWPFKKAENLLKPDHDNSLILQFRIGKTKIKFKDVEKTNFDKVKIQMVGIDGDLKTEMIPISKFSKAQKQSAMIIFWLKIAGLSILGLIILIVIFIYGNRYFKKKKEEEELRRFLIVAAKKKREEEVIMNKDEYQSRKERLYRYLEEDDDELQERKFRKKKNKKSKKKKKKKKRKNKKRSSEEVEFLEDNGIGDSLM